MGEFFTSTLQIIAILGLNGILDGTGDGVVHTEDRTLDQLDLSGGITAQAAAAAARGTAGSLSLTPGLIGGGFTAGIGRSDAAGDAKGGGGAVSRVTGVDGATGAVGVLERRVRRVSLGQAVARGRSGTGGETPLMRVIEGRSGLLV